MKKVLLWFVVISIALIVIPLVLAFSFQEKLIFVPSKLEPSFQYEFEGNWEERTIQVNGAELNAVHFKVENPEGVVVYYHGNAGSLESWGYVGLDFARLNQDVIVVDYRGYGKSSGKISSEGQLLADMQKVYDVAKDEYGEEKITVYGRSLGSGISAFISANNNPKRLVLETPYTSLPDLGAELYPKFVRKLMKYKLNTLEHVQKVGCPVYLFHGMDDQLINYSHAKKLKESKESIQLYTIEEGEHNNLPSFPDYHIALAEIFSAK